MELIDYKKSPNWATYSEFAGIVKRSDRQIQTWEKEGKLESVKIKGRVFINCAQSILKLYLALRDSVENKAINKDISELRKELLQVNIENKNKDLETKDIKNELSKIKREIQNGTLVSYEKIKEANRQFIIMSRNRQLAIKDIVMNIIKDDIDKDRYKEIEKEIKDDIEKWMRIFTESRIEAAQKDKAKIQLNVKDEEKKLQGRKKA